MILRVFVFCLSFSMYSISAFNISEDAIVGLPQGATVQYASGEFRVQCPRLPDQVVSQAEVRSLNKISVEATLEILESGMLWLEAQPWKDDQDREGYSIKAHFRLRGGRGIDGSAAPPTLPESRHPDANPVPAYVVETRDIRSDHHVRVTFRQGVFTVQGPNGVVSEIPKSNIGNFGTFSDDQLENLLRSHFYRLDVHARYEGGRMQYQITSRFTASDLPGSITRTSLRDVRTAGTRSTTGAAAAAAGGDTGQEPPEIRTNARGRQVTKSITGEDIELPTEAELAEMEQGLTHINLEELIPVRAGYKLMLTAGHWVYARFTDPRYMLDHHNNRFSDNESVNAHIFRDQEGHWTGNNDVTRGSLQGVARQRDNYLGRDVRGNDWYHKITEDGGQVWARVRNGVITNGGVNSIPREFNAITGLCRR